MSDNIIDDTEKRGYEVKLAYNMKKLNEAEANGWIDKVALYRYNIEHYEDLLNIKKGE